MANNKAEFQPNLDSVFRALAEPRRRAILERLSKNELSVKELTLQFEVSQPAISQHLAILRSVGLVNERNEGRHVIYRTNPKGLAPLVNWLAHYKTFWPERIASLQKLLKEMDK